MLLDINLKLGVLFLIMAENGIFDVGVESRDLANSYLLKVYTDILRIYFENRCF